MYYCFFCDQPADEHHEGSCRRCGRPVTKLMEEKRELTPVIVEEKSSF
jgi:hypothetical protein